MGQLVYLARRLARPRRSGYVGIVVLLGVTAGLSFVALAGARRTQSAYPRFLDSVAASTLSVSTSGVYTDEQDAAIAAIDGVIDSRTYVGFEVFALDDSGRPDFSKEWEATGTFDGRFYDMDRFTATSGRVPDRDRIDEVAVSEFTAERLDLRLGQRLDLGTYSFEQFTDPTFFESPPAPAIRTRAQLVGIGLFPEEVLQDQGDRTTRLLLTPAFSEAARPLVNYGLQGLVLEHGDADVDRVVPQIEALAPPGTLDFAMTSDATFHALQATRPLSVALALFGAITAMATIVLVGQALTRSVRAERADRAVLGALGLGPARLVAVGSVAPAASIATGLLLAVVTAVLASPLMPIGPVRRVEVDRGLDVDMTVLGVGVLVLGATLLAITSVALWLGSPHREPRRLAQRSAVAPTATALGLPPVAVTGLRFAFEASPAAGGSARSTVVGAAIAIASLTAAVTFGASLDTLVEEPSLYGWTWQATILAGNGYDNLDEVLARQILEADPDVAAWSGVYFGSDGIDGRPIPMFGMDPSAAVLPPILSGRTIGGPDEVVLGEATARLLGKGVGDTVVLGASPDDPLTVVGTATFPTVGVIHAAHPSLGVGALVVPERVPGFDRNMLAEPGAGLGPHAIFVRLRAGADFAEVFDRLRRTTAPLTGFAGLDVLPVQRPAEIVNAESLGNAPIVLGGALTGGALVSLGLALASAVRRRRRDLAVLKMLGFTRRQTGAVVTWQATAVAVVGLAVGLPLGVVAGRWMWDRFADRLDVVSRPTVPVVLLALMTFVVLAVVMLVSRPTSLSARRIEAVGLLQSS